MQTVGIFLGKSNFNSFLSTHPYYVQCYGELSQAIQDNGGKMVLLTKQSSSLDSGTFPTHWVFQDGAFLQKGPIQVDVIFNKNHFQSDQFVDVLNHPFIEEVCVNKSLTYEYFQADCPVTVVVNSLSEMKMQLENIPSKMIVAKPVDGSEGTEVFIFSKSELDQQRLNFPLLLQEFMDTSNGIPGIMTGIHDLRIAILNGQIAYSFYRTPPKGGLIANVAQGGSFFVIPNNKIPSQAVALVKKVDALFKNYPYRYYGIDVAFTPHGVKLIELNSHLGNSLESEGDVFRELNQKLAKTLVEYGNTQKNSLQT